MVSSHSDQSFGSFVLRLVICLVILSVIKSKVMKFHYSLLSLGCLYHPSVIFSPLSILRLFFQCVCVYNCYDF